MQKKITNTPHPPQVYNFHSGPLFSFSQCGGFYDHSLRFPIDFIWSLSPFNSLVLLPFVFRRTTQYSDNTFVSKFGFKIPESPLNFDKISVDDSLNKSDGEKHYQGTTHIQKIDGSRDVLQQSNVGAICASFRVTSDDGMVLVASIQEK